MDAVTFLAATRIILNMPNRRFAVIALIVCAGLVAAAIAFTGPTLASMWGFLVPGSAPQVDAGPSEAPPPSEPPPSTPPPVDDPPRVYTGPIDPCAGLHRLSDPPPADGIERIFGIGLPGDKGYVAGYAIPELRDLGPTEHASGRVVRDDDGRLAAYVVAAGDTLYAISDRFCVGSISYLGWINSVRRNGASSWEANKQEGEFEIYPGDTLNLDAHTVTSVGDEQGVVYEHRPDFYLPPQH